jgi:hypothetical protein
MFSYQHLWIEIIWSRMNKLKNLESLVNNVVRAMELIPHGLEGAGFTVTEGRL